MWCSRCISGYGVLILKLGAQQVANCLKEVGYAFCFAPLFHPALKTLKTVRQALAVPTSFNIMGPLLNPAGASYSMIGVMRAELVPLIATVMQQLGTQRSFIFHGNGMDEITTVGPMQITQVTQKTIDTITIDPESFGFNLCTSACLQGGDSETNATLLIAALKGEPGPITDTLTLNAAVAVYLYGVTPSIEAALDTVRASISTGRACALLEHLKTYTNNL